MSPFRDYDISPGTLLPLLGAGGRARTAAPHGDERAEAHEHAGDLGQRQKQLGVLHVPHLRTC
jgi:hypothetical protein